MDVRSILRLNTISVLNKKNIQKQAKSTKSKGEEGKQNQIIDAPKSIFHKHPAFYLIRGTNPSALEYQKFVTYLYKGLFYSIKNLKGPTQEYINRKKIKLPQGDPKKKYLILDLDQTLVHSVFNGEDTDIKFTYKNDQFKFNVRPYCQQFLQNMSNYYNIYIFTAGTFDYAAPIVNYLNQKKKTILGLIHRKYCMQTVSGFFIKDLRIITNRGLKDIVMVDNLVHSFGLQLTNGIPILDFINNKDDRQLQFLQKMLIELSFKQDVREFIADKLKLKQIITMDETNFMTLETYSSDKKL